MYRIIQLLSLSTLVSALASSSTLALCDALFQKFPHLVVYDPLTPSSSKTAANDTLYTTTSTSYWNEESANNRAACIFFPTGASDVSYAVRLLNNHTDVPFALKSGGHNPNLGFSSTDGGLLISFRPNMAGTTVSADRKTAKVQPGAKWNEVLETTDKYQKAIVGGRLGDVGVAGYTLGGGLSFLSSQYGFACDNVVDYEVVLANGRVANVNSGQNQDLFYALKGGGNAFAIVTTFTFMTHSIGQVWGGIRIYNANDAQAVLDATSNYTGSNPDPKSSIISTFSFTVASLIEVPLVFFFYDGVAPPKGAFGSLENISPTVDNTKVQSYPELLNANDVTNAQGLSYRTREATYPNMPFAQMSSFLKYHHQTFKNSAFSLQAKSIDVQIASFALQPITRGVAVASARAGGNRLGLDPNNGDRQFMEYDISWVNPLCDDHCPDFIKTLVQRISTYQAHRYDGVAPTNYKSGDIGFISYNPIFMNDGMADQPVLQSYGSATYQRLKGIANARDPDGLFATRQGGFKFAT